MDLEQPQERVASDLPHADVDGAGGQPGAPAPQDAHPPRADAPGPYPSATQRLIDLVDAEMPFKTGWRRYAFVFPVLPKDHPLNVPTWLYPKKFWTGRIRELATRRFHRWLAHGWIFSGLYVAFGTFQVNFHWPLQWVGGGFFVVVNVAIQLAAGRWAKRADSNKPKWRAWRKAELVRLEAELQEHEPGRPW